MATASVSSTSFWQRLKRGPWGKPVRERIEAALDAIVRQLRGDDAVVGVFVFGSYARGDYGQKSDLDLLVLLRPRLATERFAAEERITRVIIDAEVVERLPVHLAPLIAEAGNPDELSVGFLHELWKDGIILYGEAAALSMIQPGRLSPWGVVRFKLKGASPGERSRLARRLHGTARRPGLISRPGLDLARGAAFVPADQTYPVRNALDEAGALYDIIPVWRET